MNAVVDMLEALAIENETCLVANNGYCYYIQANYIILDAQWITYYRSS